MSPSTNTVTVSVAEEYKDSMSTSVADLAKDARKEEEGRGCRLHVPIAGLFVIIVLLALAAVAVPLGLILGSNSVNTINQLSGTIMDQAVQRLVVRIQDVIDLPYNLLQVTMQSLPLRHALTTNYNNLQNETDSYALLASLEFTSKWINGIACATFPNMFTPPGAPMILQAPNTTFFASYKTADGTKPLALYMDFSTDKMLFQRPYDSNTATYGPGVPVPNYPVWDYLMPSFDFFLEMITNPTNTKVFTSLAFNAGVMIFGVNQIYTAPGAATPNYACSVGMENEGALGSLFESIKITPNSHLLMIDSLTGTMLASSTPYSLFEITNTSDPVLPVRTWTPLTSNDTYANMIGKTLISSYGNFSEIPNMNGTLMLQNVDIGDGQPWFINTRYLAAPSNWLLIVAIPRADFFSSTDAANRKALILSSSVAVAGVLVSAILAFLALRPLATLARAMEMLTNMDFKALEGDILTRRSFISEVRNVQGTFATMCKAFASGIRRNQQLTRGKFTAYSNSNNNAGLSSSANAHNETNNTTANAGNYTSAITNGTAVATPSPGLNVTLPPGQDYSALGNVTALANVTNAVNGTLLPNENYSATCNVTHAVNATLLPNRDYPDLCNITSPINATLLPDQDPALCNGTSPESSACTEVPRVQMNITYYD
ncbi:hypothetical protein HK101_002521 [Irineochytrium annulatum]|nr:hypothetical protein HK101_002521 [Irineochytrium annulatum]